MTLKVGDTIFEANGFNGNIDRKNPYRPFKIVGETRLSWILEGHPDERVNKQTLEVRHQGYGPSRYVTEEERDRRFWISHHKRGIVDAVTRCEDPKVLAEIDAILTKANAG